MKQHDMVEAGGYAVAVLAVLAALTLRLRDPARALDDFAVTWWPVLALCLVIAVVGVAMGVYLHGLHGRRDRG